MKELKKDVTTIVNAIIIVIRRIVSLFIIAYVIGNTQLATNDWQIMSHKVNIGIVELFKKLMKITEIPSFMPFIKVVGIIFCIEVIIAFFLYFYFEYIEKHLPKTEKIEKLPKKKPSLNPNNNESISAMIKKF